MELAVAGAGAGAVGALGSQPCPLPWGPRPLLPTQARMEDPLRHSLSSPPQEKCPP